MAIPKCTPSRLKEVVSKIAKCAKNAGIPMLEEYIFKDPRLLEDISQGPQKSEIIKDCFEPNVSHSRSRSGIIVLPCGSGKTIVGITAAVAIKKSCLCLVTGCICRAVESAIRAFHEYRSTLCAWQAAAKTNFLLMAR